MPRIEIYTITTAQTGVAGQIQEAWKAVFARSRNGSPHD